MQRSRSQILDGDAAAGMAAVDLSADMAAGIGNDNDVAEASRGGRGARGGQVGGLAEVSSLQRQKSEDTANVDAHHTLGYTWPPPVPIIPMMHAKMAEALGMPQVHSDFGSLHDGK